VLKISDGKAAETQQPVARDSLDRSLSLLAMHRRDTILEAIARSAQELLRSSDVTRSIPKVLELIGGATNVERVHMLVVDPEGPLEERHVVGHYVWAAADIHTPELFKEASNIKFTDVGLGAWLPRLARGEMVVGNTRDFGESERRFLELGGIQSTVAVPVFVDYNWWAVLAFDACRSERVWLPAETDTFKILAELVGAAVARSDRMKKLDDANQIIENSPTVLYRLGPKEPFPLIYLSQNIRQFGYDADTLLASPHLWLSLIESGDLKVVLNNMRMLSAGRIDHDMLDFRFRQSDGSLIWLAGEAAALRDEAGQLIALEGILTDVTERKRAVETAATLARTDFLTGLPNRAAFIERLQLAFARARRGSGAFAIHYLDLDHFKDVNDTLGHPAGDALLQAVAERLRDCVREIDLVARFGGDEFAILQEDVADVGNIEALAAKIGMVLSSIFVIEGNQVHSTASIGIVPYQADIEGPEAMLMKADLALYRAKDDGRNQYSFHVAELDERAQERMTIGRDLHGALERSEFELYYQPQVDLVSGQIVGLEALIRWNHPVRGMLTPSSFISIAESNGTIFAIGQWVIEEACRQMRQWRDQHVALPLMAVNVSASQFHFENSLDCVVRDALEKYRLAPGELEIELTESVLMVSTQKYGAAFERLRQIGVRIAIDDFGTGFSSLDYLRSFHVARLKLSSQFIDEIITKPDVAAIVRATIGLAKELGIDVIAEGVNSDEQRKFLIAAGCRSAQGYLLGYPMPANQVTALLLRNHQDLPADPARMSRV